MKTFLLLLLVTSTVFAHSPGTLKAHEDGVWKINFSPEGEHFVTAGGDGKVKVWWTECFCSLTSFNHDSNFKVYDAAYLPKQRIVSTSLDGSIYVWNSETGEKLHEITDHTENASHVRAARDGSRFYIASADDRVREYDAETYAPLSSVKTKSPVGIMPYGPARWLTISLEGIQLWDALAGNVTHTFNQSPYYFAMEPIGESLVFVGGNPSQGGELQIIDVAEKKVVKTLDRISGIVWQLAVSPNLEWVGASNLNGPVFVWERATGKLIYSSEKTVPSTISLAFFPEGRAILIGDSSGTVHSARF